MVGGLKVCVSSVQLDSGRNICLHTYAKLLIWQCLFVLCDWKQLDALVHFPFVNVFFTLFFIFVVILYTTIFNISKQIRTIFALGNLDMLPVYFNWITMHGTSLVWFRKFWTLNRSLVLKINCSHSNRKNFIPYLTNVECSCCRIGSRLPSFKRCSVCV